MLKASHTGKFIIIPLHLQTPYNVARSIVEVELFINQSKYSHVNFAAKFVQVDFNILSQNSIFAICTDHGSIFACTSYVALYVPKVNSSNIYNEDAHDNHILINQKRTLKIEKIENSTFLKFLSATYLQFLGPSHLHF